MVAKPSKSFNLHCSFAWMSYKLLQLGYLGVSTLLPPICPQTLSHRPHSSMLGFLGFSAPHDHIQVSTSCQKPLASAQDIAFFLIQKLQLIPAPLPSIYIPPGLESVSLSVTLSSSGLCVCVQQLGSRSVLEKPFRLSPCQSSMESFWLCRVLPPSKLGRLFFKRGAND